MDTPQDLSNRLLDLSSEYSRNSDLLSEILGAKPKLWLAIRLKSKSDTSAEREWQATEAGIQETTLKLKLKSLEKEMSAVRTKLRVMDTEAHNLY